MSVSNAVYVYRRGGSGQHALDEQAKACKMIATLKGLTITDWKDETVGTLMIEHLQNSMSDGSTLIFADPSTLHPRPSEGIKIASALLAKNVNLVCASGPGGQYDIYGLRANLQPIQSLEKQVFDLQAELLAQRAEFDADFETFSKALEAQMVKILNDRGIGITQLLRPANLEATGLVANPFEGKKLRALRQSLGFTQSEVAALLDPPVDKSVVSKAEAAGSGESRYEDVLMALQVEEIRRSQAVKKALRSGDAGKSNLVEGIGEMFRVAT
ncbi:hypothetical protein J2X72_003015 [Phyllobacterium sp. 1468]|uniref:helix-turn-helix transcriptional regulator n=1 Tax=Phyllobacterium sp. 1468 TaxID=2817759 RepID=UPI00285F1707|nr:helix-turn-helix transcriptional regulator [Phyllobacterium sp. 1468]MDR6634215.1 hypothetical protein [Phyllobacterium sp. 1468]